MLLLLSILSGCSIDRRPTTPEMPPPILSPEAPPEMPPSIPGPETTPQPSPPETKPQNRVPETPAPDARSKTALEISRQALLYLRKQQPDPAINLLERSINLNPHNGQTYFHMAQAWIMKGNQDQALEFNRMAEIQLSTDPEWRARIAAQRKIIEGMGL